jgi:hypothetical protein
MNTYGIGREYDINMIPDANMKTTTSQYKFVGMQPGTTTADRTVGLCLKTSTASGPTASSYFAIGVNQSLLSSGSEVCSVRVFGISQVTCAESITAGEFVIASDGGETTTAIGRAAAVDNGVSITAATMSLSSHQVVMGRAWEDGSTNTVIAVMISPQLYDHNLVKA